MLKPRFWTLAGIILAAAASRLIPHPPNLTPIAAMALFGGAYFNDKRAAFAVPLSAMLLSDLALGLIRYGAAIFPMMPFVYAAFAGTVVLGLMLRHRPSAFRIGSAALVAAVLFFLVTNLGVWTGGHLYPRTLEGLVTCYVAAIPFFRNMLLGNVLYTALLFGGFGLAQRVFSGLRDDAIVGGASS